MDRARLPGPIGKFLAQPMPEDAAGLYRNIEIARQRGRNRKSAARAAIAASGIMAAVTALLLLAIRVPRPADETDPLRLANQAPLPASVQPQRAYQALPLSDGSWVSVASGARLDVLESSAKRFTVALRRGRARFDVRPNGPRTWRVECGPTTIEVVGTSFQIERTDVMVQVSVTRGTVLVRGQGVSDGVQQLHAGHALSVMLPARPATTARASASAPLANDDSLNEAGPGPTEAAWREAARNARWSTAWEKLSVSGLRHESETAVRVRDLLLLADVARLSGHPREATMPLERIVTQYGNDPRAALASFTLGTMRLDLLSEPEQAARDIARAMELGLPRALTEDALARLTEAYARAGDTQRARDTSRQYRQRFPQGRRTREIDRFSPPD